VLVQSVVRRATFIMQFINVGLCKYETDLFHDRPRRSSFGDREAKARAHKFQSG